LRTLLSLLLLSPLLCLLLRPLLSSLLLRTLLRTLLLSLGLRRLPLLLCPLLRCLLFASALGGLFLCRSLPCGFLLSLLFRGTARRFFLAARRSGTWGVAHAAEHQYDYSGEPCVHGASPLDFAVTCRGRARRCARKAEIHCARLRASFAMSSALPIFAETGSAVCD
jgi:hypothetical protein